MNRFRWDKKGVYTKIDHIFIALNEIKPTDQKGNLLPEEERKFLIESVIRGISLLDEWSIYWWNEILQLRFFIDQSRTILWYFRKDKRQRIIIRRLKMDSDNDPTFEAKRHGLFPHSETPYLVLSDYWERAAHAALEYEQKYRTSY